MTHYCSFHPLLPAHWKCEHCNSDLCQGCLPEQGVFADALSCPNCNASLTPLLSGAQPSSLWQQSGAILSLPLRQQTGVFLCSLLTVFTLVALANQPLVISLVASALVTLVYGLRLLSLLINGAGRKARAPSLNTLFRLQSYSAALPTIGIVAASAAVCVFLLRSQSYLAAAFALIVVFFTLPVLVIMQAQRDKRLSVSSVSHFVQVIANLGPNYVALCCWGLLVFFAGLSAIDGLQVYAPSVLQKALAPFFLAYLVLVWISALAVSVPAAPSKSNLPSRSRSISLAENIEDAQLGIALREGKYDQVVALLEEDYYRNGMNDYRLDQLYRLSVAQDREVTLAEYGALFMSMLVRRGRDDEVLKLLRTLRKKREDYRVSDAQLCLDLVQICERKGKQKLLLWLVQDAHCRFPEEQRLVAEMYRAAAKVLHKGFNNHDKALAYMKRAVQARDMYENNDAGTQVPLQ